jgi:hypothetical protein
VTYVIQFVAMVIALVSQFFDSVRKDATGSPLRTRHRLPIPTIPGSIIFAFIIASFGASIVSTHSDRKDAARKEMHTQQENTQLHASVQALTNLDATAFDKSLKHLDQISEQAQKAEAVTTRNIEQSSSLLRQNIETRLVPTKTVQLAVVLDAPRLGSKEARRLALSDFNGSSFEQGDAALKGLVCGHPDRIQSFELRIVLSSVPHLDCVVTRTVSPNGCFWNMLLGVLDDSGKEIHREDVGAAGVAVDRADLALLQKAHPGAHMIMLACKFFPIGDRVGQPLYANSFGEADRRATLTLSGEEPIDELADALEPAIPKYIQVIVDGWYSLHSTEESRPSFERMWRLTRGGPSDVYVEFGGHTIEYDYAEVDDGGAR